jgi:hypothetical protein
MNIFLILLALGLIALVVQKVRTRHTTENMVARSKARAEARAQCIGAPHEDDGTIDYIRPVVKGIWTTDEVK